MSFLVRDAYEAIDAFAPFDTADAWDNVGLLLGRMDRPVDTILTALDATQGLAREAREVGAQLLVTHHPLLLTPFRRLAEDTPEAALLCEMVRAGLSMIAAHTNLDRADGGVNDALVEKLGFSADAAEGFLRAGTLPGPTRLFALIRHIEERLGTKAVLFGPHDLHVTRFAVCSGSGGSELEAAAGHGAEVFITGEIKHHEALEAAARGMAVIAAGHRATEICAADVLAKHLQSAADRVQSNIRVIVSRVDPFA